MTAAAKLSVVPDPPSRPTRKRSAEVGRTVAGMAIDHLQCRDYGHLWRPRNARKIGRIYEQTLVCERCTTERVRHLSARGELLDAHYSYAAGYTMKGLGRLTGADRDQIRLASILAVLEP